MHNLAYHTNNGNSQEGLLEREKEEREFRDQFITIVNKRYCFSSIRIGNTFTFSGLSLGRRGPSGTNDM